MLLLRRHYYTTAKARQHQNMKKDAKILIRVFDTKKPRQAWGLDGARVLYFTLVCEPVFGVVLSSQKSRGFARGIFETPSKVVRWSLPMVAQSICCSEYARSAVFVSVTLERAFPRFIGTLDKRGIGYLDLAPRPRSHRIQPRL